MLALEIEIAHTFQPPYIAVIVPIHEQGGDIDLYLSEHNKQWLNCSILT